MKGCVILTYEEVCEKFNEIMSFLKKESYENVFNEIHKTVVRREQATGGACMRRGYYCPSLVMDIILGNVNRGRLIKRLRNQKVNYTYGFDDLGRLVTIIEHTEVGDFFEYIIHDGDVQYGVQFHHYRWSGKEYLHLISKCCYEGNKLKSYEKYLYQDDEKTFSEYQGEFYHYSKDCLEYERIFVLRGMERRLPINEITRYKFKIENGFLVNFTGNSGNTYPVRLKRKIPE